MFRRNGKYDLNLPLNLRVSIRTRGPRTCNRDLFSHRVGLMRIDRMPSSIPGSTASTLFYLKRSVVFFYRIFICPSFLLYFLLLLASDDISFFFFFLSFFLLQFHSAARKREAFDPVFTVAAAVTRLRARKASLFFFFFSNARVSTPRRPTF